MNFFSNFKSTLVSNGLQETKIMLKCANDWIEEFKVALPLCISFKTCYFDAKGRYLTFLLRADRAISIKTCYFPSVFFTSRRFTIVSDFDPKYPEGLFLC